MTKKHYIAIAKALGKAYNLIEKYQNGSSDTDAMTPELAMEALLADFVEIFEADNPNFDRARFIEAVSDASLALKNNEYERRVQEYEAQGLTRSDAQGVVDVEMDLK